MRRAPAVPALAALALPGLLALAACGSDDAPTIDAGATTTGGDATTTSTTAATTSTTAAPSTTIAVQAVDLTLTGEGGTVEATLTYDGDQLCLTGTTEGLGPITDAHVHAGREGETGPPVVDFGIETDGDGPFEGCATVGAEGGVVLVDPASYYVNVHTAEHPDGAARAQVG